MIKITTNKFLTKIQDNEYIGVIKTSSFKEITGLEDLSLIKEISTTPVELSREEEIEKIVEEVWEVHSLGSWKPTARGSAWGRSIDIDGVQYPKEKVFEAMDLTPKLFENLLKASILKSTSTSKQSLLTSEYISQMILIIKTHCTTDKYNVDPCSFFEVRRLHHFCPNEMFAKSLIPSHSLYFKMSYDASKEPCVDLSGEISGAFVADITTRMNFMLRKFWFYHEGEKLYFPEISTDRAATLINNMKLCYEQKPETFSNRADISSIVGVLLEDSIYKISRQFALLKTAEGKRRIVRSSELIPSIYHILMRNVGVYGKEKISKQKPEKWRKTQ